MAKIRTIKRAAHLPTPYFVRAMEEIERQTDRGAAIAGTAYLDLLLRESLEGAMRQNEALQDQLFTNRGPLEDFSARIMVAFALGLIGTGAYMDLGALRNVRNAFAHSADAFGFDRNDVAALCVNLWMPRHIKYRGHTAPTTPREFFILGVKLIADGLISVKLSPASWQFILAGPPLPAAPKASRKKRQRPSDPAR